MVFPGAPGTISHDYGTYSDIFSAFLSGKSSGALSGSSSGVSLRFPARRLPTAIIAAYLLVLFLQYLLKCCLTPYLCESDRGLLRQHLGPLFLSFAGLVFFKFLLVFVLVCFWGVCDGDSHSCVFQKGRWIFIKHCGFSIRPNGFSSTSCFQKHPNQKQIISNFFLKKMCLLFEVYV